MDNATQGRGRPRSALPDVPNPNAFARWLASSGKHPRDVARILRVSDAIVYLWRRGTKAPSLSNAVRIEKLSDGAVPCDSWETA